MTRHYAFVPGIGGFMLQEEDSMMLRGDRLMPQHRLLKFNRFMDHEDGMLCNIIMQSEGLSFDEANALIRFQVSEILDKAQHEDRCQFGRLGYIFFDPDCHISFIAADLMDYDPENFGLHTIALKSWMDIERERKGISESNEEAPVVQIRAQRRTDVIELPKVWLRRAAIVLLILTFFFAGIVPHSHRHENQHFANIVNTGMIFQAFNTLDTQSWDESWEYANTDSVFQVSAALMEDIETTSADDSSPIEGTLAEPASDVKPENTVIGEQNSTIVTAKPEKTYLIVVGSCSTLEDAELTVRRMNKKGYDDLEILPSNNRFRVIIKSFDVKSDAEFFLDDLRANSPFNDAWLLAVRTSSLSYIIKNKDNGQLPMELSHSNRSAERDQG